MTPPDHIPWWWRALAWLPTKFFIPCAVCLFWRGALAGAILLGLLQLAAHALNMD